MSFNSINGQNHSIKRVSLKRHYDNRGDFLKLIQPALFGEGFSSFRMTESFISTSKKGVIRGLHFQAPPLDHDKIIVCISGKAFDVTLDLRTGSSRFGTYESFILSGDQPEAAWIPKGFAHGFQALEDSTVMIYFTNSVYSPEHDKGILWSSADIAWPLAGDQLSVRDQGFPHLSQFESPFV